MTELLVVDYSVSRPSPASLRAAGYSGALRYLAPLPNSKVITRPELDALRAAGLGIGVVWESTADRALGGAQAGVRDGHEANRQADAIGFPSEWPIYFAVDFDAQPAQMGALADYLHAAGDGGRPVGVYGSFSVVETMLARGAAVWAWQTMAWSRGRTSARAHLLQRIKPTRGPIAGTDENVVLAGGGGLWWSNQPAPAPGPSLPPEPSQPPKPQPQTRLVYRSEADHMELHDVEVAIDDKGYGLAHTDFPFEKVAAVSGYEDLDAEQAGKYGHFEKALMHQRDGKLDIYVEGGAAGFVVPVRVAVCD